MKYYLTRISVIVTLSICRIVDGTIITLFTGIASLPT